MVMVAILKNRSNATIMLHIAVKTLSGQLKSIFDVTFSSRIDNALNHGEYQTTNKTPISPRPLPGKKPGCPGQLAHASPESLKLTTKKTSSFSSNESWNLRSNGCHPKPYQLKPIGIIKTFFCYQAPNACNQHHEFNSISQNSI